MTGFKFSSQVVSLGLPFSSNLIKVASTLLGDDGSGVSSLILHLEIFKLSFKSVPGLLGGSNLGVESINGLFCLCNTAGELVLAGLKLIDTSKTFNFKLRTPKLNLSLSLRQSAENIILLLRFFLNFFTEVFGLSVEILEFGQKRST